MVNLISVSPQNLTKYLSTSIEIILGQKPINLSKEQKIIVSRIYKNINTLCKMTKKQVIELLKTQPAYQQAITQLYFDKFINNTSIISSQPHHPQQLLLNNDMISQQCIGIDYRIQFTLSTINFKKVMKPIIFIVFQIKDGRKIELYLSLEIFDKLRRELSMRLKDIFTIEMKTI